MQLWSKRSMSISVARVTIWGQLPFCSRVLLAIQCDTLVVWLSWGNSQFLECKLSFPPLRRALTNLRLSVLDAWVKTFSEEQFAREMVNHWVTGCTLKKSRLCMGVERYLEALAGRKQRPRLQILWKMWWWKLCYQSFGFFWPWVYGMGGRGEYGSKVT